MKRVVMLASVLLLGACGPIGGPRELFTGTLADLPRRLVGEPSLAAAPPAAATQACRESIASAAQSHGAVAVEVVDAGDSEVLPDGMTETPLEARITYERAGETQVRQARIACRQDRDGQVVALADSAA